MLYWARDERAICATAEKYENYCRTIAFNILNNSDDAEECTNDTYLAAWDSIPPQRPNPLSSYLGKITRNIALNRYKHYSAKKRGAGQVPSVLSELENCIPSRMTVELQIDENELTDAINAFLHAQVRQKRYIFIRRYWHLWSVSRIAEEYGMSEAKVTSILFRMRKDLKKHLEKGGIAI